MTETQERPRPPETRLLHLAHVSMLFSSTKKEVRHDAQKIFKSNYHWITGTEAGQAPVLPTLRVAAWDAGYAFTAYKSNWIAIKRSLIHDRSLRKGGVTAVENDRVKGPGHDLNVCWMQFKNNQLGKITVLSSHYATKGRPDGKGIGRRNLQVNRELAREIGDLGDTYGKGSSLVFYGGDQNIVDRHNDTFFGEGFTSAWDELKKYENTGHGNIDVIASYNKDGRVEAKYVRALDDKEQFMHTDHFPVEAGFVVRLLDKD